MQHLIADLSTHSLERLVASLESRIIHGTASSSDIDTYVQMQLEIAERELGRIDGAVDPRD
jgi:hypothetical protein